MAKAIYLGARVTPSFMLTKTTSNITGYSKSIEVGDLICFDKQLEEKSYRGLGVVRRDFNGMFDNPEDAINNHFDASVIGIDNDEVRELRKNFDFMATIGNY